jgi:SAM-dependent methyltransferase
VFDTKSFDNEAKFFFDSQARGVRKGKLTLSNHCYVSGRDPRIWANHEAYHGLINSILGLAGVKSDSNGLEVGCASGYLAAGLSEKMKQYLGVDVSSSSIALAKKMNLNNATFQVENGNELTIADNSFDFSVFYDAITNFPAVGDAAGIISEMCRVTKPGGKVIIGSVPDSHKYDEYILAVSKYQKYLDDIYGGRENYYDDLDLSVQAEGGIYCYHFEKSSFQKLASSIGVVCEFHPVHISNPFHQYRYNVVLSV